MVDLGPVETAESDLGGTRPVPARHFGYQETIIAPQPSALSLPPTYLGRYEMEPYPRIHLSFRLQQLNRIPIIQQPAS